MRPGLSFPALAASQALSLLGTRMSGVAVGFAVYAATGKAAPLLLFFFFSELPATLMGSLAGAYVDKKDARRIAVAADAAQALASAFLALSFLLHLFSPPILYAVGLAQGLAGAFQEPAAGVIVSRLVPDKGRDRATALLGAAHPMAGLLAPALAGLLYPLIGIAGIVGIDLATFLVSALTLLSLRLPSPSSDGPVEAESLGSGLRAGLRFLFVEKRALGVLVVVAAFANFLLNGPLGLAIPYLLARSGDTGSAGLALALEGAGGIAGSALLTVLGQARSRPRSFLLGLCLAGAGMTALGIARPALVIGSCLFFVIAALQSWSRLSATLMAEAPPAMRGRILSISAQLGYLGATLSFFLIGPLADRVAEPAARGGGLPPPFTGPGSGMGLIVSLAGIVLFALAAATLASPAIRRLGREDPLLMPTPGPRATADEGGTSA